jgi:hypothetical protein
MGIDEDLFTYELTEAQWKDVRYALFFMHSALIDAKLTGSMQELTTKEAINLCSQLLRPDNYASFRLSKDRVGDLEFAVPTLTECCGERIVRPTLRSKWRCYGCGLFIINGLKAILVGGSRATYNAPRIKGGATTGRNTTADHRAQSELSDSGEDMP